MQSKILTVTLNTETDPIFLLSIIFLLLHHLFLPIFLSSPFSFLLFYSLSLLFLVLRLPPLLLFLSTFLSLPSHFTLPSALPNLFIFPPFSSFPFLLFLLTLVLLTLPLFRFPFLSFLCYLISLLFPSFFFLQLFSRPSPLYSLPSLSFLFLSSHHFVHVPVIIVHSYPLLST